jgi:proteasome inhibitor subunit 1 (PI31)
MATNALDPSAIVSLLSTLLPPSAKGLASPHDAIAALFHAAMSALAFRLIAVDDSSPVVSSPVNVLPVEWNTNGPGHYTFKYRHEQSSLEFVMKVSKLGGRVLVNAIAVEVRTSIFEFCIHTYLLEKSDKAAYLDVSTNDFVSPSFFPHDLNATDAQPLIHGFISSNRVTDLLSQFKLQIVQKLVPGLRKDGYTEDAVDTSTNAGGSNSPQSPNSLPSRPRPEAPPYVPDQNPYRLPSHIPPENPLQIGRRDLDPIPMNPSNLFSPPSLFPPGSGDGMYVGPDHPIFAGRGRGAFGDHGPWGGDGYLPPMGAPPGARFDPVGPGLGPFPDGGGIGSLGRGRGASPRGNMGSPDNDEFMPPGAVSLPIFLRDSQPTYSLRFVI